MPAVPSMTSPDGCRSADSRNSETARDSAGRSTTPDAMTRPLWTANRGYIAASRLPEQGAAATRQRDTSALGREELLAALITGNA